MSCTTTKDCKTVLQTSEYPKPKAKWQSAELLGSEVDRLLDGLCDPILVMRQKNRAVEFSGILHFEVAFRPSQLPSPIELAEALLAALQQKVEEAHNSPTLLGVKAVAR